MLDIIVGLIFIGGLAVYFSVPLFIKWKARQYATQKLIQEKQFKPMCKVEPVTVEEVQSMVSEISDEDYKAILDAEIPVEPVLVAKKAPAKKSPKKPTKKKPAANRRRNPNSKE